VRPGRATDRGRVGRVVLFAAALAAGPTGRASARPPTAPVVQLVVDAREVHCTADGRSCDAHPEIDGLCHAALTLCVGARAGISRLRVGGTPAVVGPLVSALVDLPGATARPRGVRFRPALSPRCVSLSSVALGRETAAHVVLGGRTTAGRSGRARLSLGCNGTPPPPDAPPPPPPPPPGDPAPLSFVREVIDPEGGGQLSSDVAAGDIDGDGAPDVVVSGFLRLLWYRNPGWEPTTIALGGFGRGAKTLVRDLDGDGRPDVVSGSLDLLGTPAMIWFRNTPAGWERHVFSDVAYCHDLVFGDLDADGRADALCLDQQRGQVLWLGPPADPLAAWTPHTIDPNENAMGSAIADIDGDGRVDVVVGRAWYRNAGDGTWSRHRYTDLTIAGFDGFADYAKVSALDLDGDGRLDIFATLYAETPAGSVHAFLAPDDPAADQPWTHVLLDPGPLFGVHSQAAASFDGSTRPQIMVGETNIGGFDFGVAPHPHIYVYRVLGRADDPAGWERTAIDAVGAHEVQAVDLDGDGRPDLIGHEENTQLIGRNGAVFAWRNRSN